MDNNTIDTLQDELKQDLLPWTMLLYVIIGYGLMMTEAPKGMSQAMPPLGLLLLGAVAAAWIMRQRYYYTSAWLMIIAPILVLVLISRHFPDSEAYHALLFPILGAALTLGPKACIATTLASTIILWPGMMSTGTPSLNILPFVTNLFVLWGAAFLICMSQRPQRTMIAWAWQGYEQARGHLEEARDRQLELKQALEDLELASNQTIRLNDMLAAAQEAVEEARKAKADFVANVSHELRTPLNMIIGFSDMILGSPGVYARRLPPALMADIAAIKRNSQHLADLVDDVLDLSEADTGRMQILKEWGSIQGIVGEATEAVTALFEQKGLSLTVDVPENLPSIYCDHTRIRQVILNLLSNAGRFTDKGGAEVRVVIENDMFVVSVLDTGPGMSPKHLDHMFEPFQQADVSIRRRYGGSGLGLSISKRFVEMHGGKIWLESEVNKGTTAYFSLPLQSELPKDVAERWFGPYQEYSPRTRRSLAPEIGSRPLVVVVEQGNALCYLIKRYLEDLEAVQARSIEEASEIAEANAAVAVVINEAPSVTLSGTLSRLSQMSFDIPILSCWIPEQDAPYADIGAQDYLVKPISRSTLLEKMHHLAPDARSVLLVDDDPEARQLFRRMLASAEKEYIVLDADNGETALSLLRERHPDLLLLDLIMPNVDGFAVLEEKAKEARIRDIPVIIISAKDPQRQPIVSKMLTLTRQRGLSARDLMLSLDSITHALKPRFGAPTRPETLAASEASE